MKLLLKKEFTLCMHPAAWMMLGLSALVLAPNYPFSVSFFYCTLGIFFICVSGRENGDILFTVTLPVSRRQIVAARILFACCLEAAQLLLCGLFIPLRVSLMGAANAAGMDANTALLGEGLIVLALFNLVFFPAWYKDVRKVGAPFVLASAAVFAYIILAVAATYAIPFVRDRLDTPDPAHMAEKLLFLLAGLLIYGAAAWAAIRLSARRFEGQDLQN